MRVGPARCLVSIFTLRSTIHRPKRAANASHFIGSEVKLAAETYSSQGRRCCQCRISGWQGLEPTCGYTKPGRLTKNELHNQTTVRRHNPVFYRDFRVAVLSFPEVTTDPFEFRLTRLLPRTISDLPYDLTWTPAPYGQNHCATK